MVFQAKPKLHQNWGSLCAACCRSLPFFVCQWRNAGPFFSSCPTATRAQLPTIEESVEIQQHCLVTPTLTTLSTNRLPEALLSGQRRQARPVPGAGCSRDENRCCSLPVMAKLVPGVGGHREENQCCLLPVVARRVPGAANHFPKCG